METEGNTPSGAETLNRIRTELKVPKSKRNEFGKYDYRSCEDILEALKPLLSKYGVTLEITDKLKQVGDRYYIKATARLFTENRMIESVGYAREEEVKKGMSADQVTGSASSYARKYALNGLFLIDDSREVDSVEEEPITKEQALEINKLLNETDSDRKKFLKVAGVDQVEQIPSSKYESLLGMLNRKKSK